MSLKDWKEIIGIPLVGAPIGFIIITGLEKLFGMRTIWDIYTPLSIIIVCLLSIIIGVWLVGSD